jgi:sulfate transport system substrate-binding protein
MRTYLVVLLSVVAIVGAGVWLVAGSARHNAGAVELLNVSYDPTRELWREINEAFVPAYLERTGVQLEFKQSHGGSSTQARAVLDGQPADVVTLALWLDTDALREKELIQPGWEERLPNRSLPYHSTIVFVVRKGNPKDVRDWPDLVRPGVEIITPNPKTSGNGKLSFLAAYGAALRLHGSHDAAREFITEVYRRTPVLDTGARGATTTFAQKKIGDVHLTWENEAHLEVRESGGELELVYPPSSIKAEPHVAVVDANVDRKGTRDAAEAYMKFLYTRDAQEIIARHYYRPSNEEVLKQHADRLPPLTLFTVEEVAGSWTEAQAKFFAERALFDQIYQPGH